VYQQSTQMFQRRVNIDILQTSAICL